MGSSTGFSDPPRERCYSCCPVCSHPLLMALLVGFLWLYRFGNIKIWRDHSRLCNLHPKNVGSFLSYNNPWKFTAHVQDLRRCHLVGFCGGKANMILLWILGGLGSQYDKGCQICQELGWSLSPHLSSSHFSGALTLILFQDERGGTVCVCVSVFDGHWSKCSCVLLRQNLVWDCTYSCDLTAPWNHSCSVPL